MATVCQDLFPEARNAPELLGINDRCQIRTQDGHRVVMVSGIVLAHYAVADRMAEAHAMVSLVEQGWADQNDVARAFGYSARTLRRVNVGMRRVDWLRWANPAAILQGAHDRPIPGGKLCTGSRHKGIRIARSHGGLGSLRALFASCSSAWDGKSIPISQICCPWRRRRTRTQNCPLFALPPRRLPPATTPIRVIVPPTDCWPDLDYWKMRLPCSVRPLRFRERAFCWRCRF